MRLYDFTTIEQLATAVQTLLNKSKRLRASGFLNVGSPTTLTISSGEVTATQSFHSIATEASASSDILDTINGGLLGDIIFLSAAAGTAEITIKDATDNLRLANADFVLSSRDTISFIMLAQDFWYELSRSDNT